MVFYDYDEITTLTECNLENTISQKYEEMKAGTWIPEPMDVFPEEFKLFFSENAKARKMFEEIHGEL